MVDDIDIKILKYLQKEGRATASEIAIKLDLTVPTITERIKKLKESSVIKGFQAIIDPKALSLDVSAMITVVSSSSNSYQEVIRKAVECPEVIQCFSTTGMGSLLLWVSTNNSQSLEELLRKIQSWSNVTRTETQVILSTYKSFLSFRSKGGLFIALLLFYKIIVVYSIVFPYLIRKIVYLSNIICYIIRIFNNISTR